MSQFNWNQNAFATSIYSSAQGPSTNTNAAVPATVETASSYTPPFQTHYQYSTNALSNTAADARPPASQCPQLVGLPPIRLMGASSKVCGLHVDTVGTRGKQILKPIRYETGSIYYCARIFYRTLWMLSGMTTPFPEDLSAISSIEVLKDFLGEATISLFMMQSRIKTPRQTVMETIFVPAVYSAGNPDVFQLTWEIIFAMHLFRTLAKERKLTAAVVLSPNGTVIHIVTATTVMEECFRFICNARNYGVSRLSFAIMPPVKLEARPALIDTRASIIVAANQAYMVVDRPHKCCLERAFQDLVSYIPDQTYQAWFTSRPAETACKRYCSPDEDRFPSKRVKTCPADAPRPSTDSTGLPSFNIEYHPDACGFTHEAHSALFEGGRQGLSDFYEYFRTI